MFSSNYELNSILIIIIFFQILFQSFGNLFILKISFQENFSLQLEATFCRQQAEEPAIKDKNYFFVLFQILSFSHFEEFHWVINVICSNNPTHWREQETRVLSRFWVFFLSGNRASLRTSLIGLKTSLLRQWFLCSVCLFY